MWALTVCGCMRGGERTCLDGPRSTTFPSFVPVPPSRPFACFHLSHDSRPSTPRTHLSTPRFRLVSIVITLRASRACDDKRESATG